MSRKSPLKPVKVLLVEDHDDTREAIRSWLQADGYKVFAVAGVEAARKTARKSKFDILLCDIFLDDGTGWKLLQELRSAATQPFVPVAMSADGAPDTIAHSRALGYYAHLVKPFGPEMRPTLEAVKAELERRRNHTGE